MSEPKPFASLSSGLLARKGAARPAMRPQGFGQAGQSLEDLGWDDMGFEPPKPGENARDASHDAFGDEVASHPRVHPTGLTPVHSPVHSQQADLAARVADIEPAEAEAEAESEDDETAEIQEPQADIAPQPEAAPEPAAEDAAEPPVVAQVVKLPPAQRAAYRSAPRPRAAPGSKARAAFTLRLDPDRHLKLRLACALDGRSAQHFVTDALDQMLANMPELQAVAVKAKPKG